MHSDAVTVQAAPALRPYQLAAVGAVAEQYASGRKSTLVVQATGTGKTVVFSEVARQHVAQGSRVLVLAHRTELLEQAAAKLAAVGMHAAIEQAEARAGNAAVVVASVQTLRGARLHSFAPDAFGLVIVDEAHHAAAASYRAVLAHFQAARILGVTATADRGDGGALGAVFESVASAYSMRQAIDDGWLAPIRARRVVVDGLDLSTLRTRAGDLDQAELAAVMNAEGAVLRVVSPMLELSGARPTVVFAVDRAHAHALAESLNRHRAGIARAIDGTASADDRRQLLADFRAGGFQYLVNCALFVEGFDEPSIACVAVVRPTKSRALYTQMIGRGTRLAPGKVDCLVLDFAGNAGRHRLIGPADALAGAAVADDVRAEIERLLVVPGQQLLAEIVAAADGEVARRRAELGLTVLATYRATAVDPFLGKLEPAVEAAWTQEPATARQVAALGTAGLEKLPPQLTKGEASRWLAAVEQRRAAGLCSLKQARVLSRYSIRTADLTRESATEMLAALAEGGWRPAALDWFRYGLGDAPRGDGC